MAIKKVKLPNNTVVDINDARIPGIDSSPTANSTNLVTSGGVKAALTNGSVTKVGTATVGAANRPIYLNAGTPTVTNPGEAFLSWGGQSISGGVTPIGMALSEEHSANRTAFINGDLVTMEYSSNGGSTWTDYGYSASNKSAFFTTSFSVPIGRANSSTSVVANQSKTRITLTAQNGSSPARRVYTNPKKLLINISSATAPTLLIEYRSGTNYQNDGAWSTFGTYTVSGWSGWNDIPLIMGTLGGGSNQTGNAWQLRLTLTITSVSSNYPTTASVLGVRLFGENAWTTPSTLATTGHLYSYDMDQNATFPAKVTASQFVKSGGTSAQFLKADGSVDSNSYLTTGSASSTYATQTALANGLATKQNTLTFDSEPTQSSERPVTSGGVYTALQGKQDSLTIDTALSTQSTNTVQNKAVAGEFGKVTYVGDTLEDVDDIPDEPDYDPEVIIGGGGSELIIGTQTASTGAWTGVSKLPSASNFASGYQFTYWLPYAGSGNATLTLTFQDGTTKTINLYYSGSSRLTTHFPAGNKLDFLYLENANVAGTYYTGAWVARGYNSDTTYAVYSNYERRFLASASAPLYRYKLCGYDLAGKIVPLTITNQTDLTIVQKTPVTLGIDPIKGIMYYNTTTAITAVTTTFGSLYNETAISAQYTFNSNIPVYTDLYLKGTYDATTGLFTLDTTNGTSWYVTAPNRASDGTYTSVFTSGAYYMYVGPSTTSANAVQLKYNNPLYYYDGSKLTLVDLTGTKAYVDSMVGNLETLLAAI